MATEELQQTPQEVIPATESETTSTGSRLLDLPAELRAQIFSLVMAEKGWIGVRYVDMSRLRFIKCKELRPMRDLHADFTCAGLVLVNHQTRNEALSMFYALNEFTCTHHDIDSIFNILASRKLLSRLTRFYLHTWIARPPPQLPFLLDSTNNGVEERVQATANTFAASGLTEDVLRFPVDVQDLPESGGGTTRISWLSLAEMSHYEPTDDGWDRCFRRKKAHVENAKQE
ncbi:uncharacterized protein LTR77_009346 [Saxophila tyrrhenica]|uniref:Uncharacterized protein n=1 Tax=Saxophila tyrrhenica TaxID=1690608 RepID=A0AAV9P2Q4_9PEZI|nr:hypothetical protein LTR77_009346 [Saxophila tyrrhenica]